MNKNIKRFFCIMNITLFVGIAIYFAIEDMIDYSIIFSFVSFIMMVLYLPVIFDNDDSNIKKDNNDRNDKNYKFDYKIEFYDNKKEQTLYMRTKTKKYYDDYIVFDLETTGFNPKKSEIIEIGALKYVNNELVDIFNFLIKPKERLPKEIEKLTGITEYMLENCETIEIILPKFIEFIGDFTLVAHNSSFDLSFIEENIKNLNLKMIENKNIDTLYLARKNITELSSHKLEVLKKHFKLNYKSHRALDDCLVTNYIYQYCKDKNTIKN